MSFILNFYVSRELVVQQEMHETAGLQQLLLYQASCHEIHLSQKESSPTEPILGNDVVHQSSDLNQMHL